MKVEPESGVRVSSLKPESKARASPMPFAVWEKMAGAIASRLILTGSLFPWAVETVIVTLDRITSKGIWKFIWPGDTKYKGAAIGPGNEGSWTSTLVPRRSVGSGIDSAERVAVARFEPNTEARVPGLRWVPNEAPFRTPVTFGDVCADTTNPVSNQNMRRCMYPLYRYSESGISNTVCGPVAQKASTLHPRCASAACPPTPLPYSAAVVSAVFGGVAAAFCGRLTAAFFALFREAFTGTFFAAALAAGACWALAAVAASAFTLAHRLRVASAMAFLPAALSFRFGLGASGATGDDGPDDFLDSAHRFRCASPMRFRAAALIFRRLPVGPSGVAAVAVGPPWSVARSSAI